MDIVNPLVRGPKLRLCYIRKSQGHTYGFNVCTYPDIDGQYVSKVDKSSPAHNANLKEEDRIIKVNGTSIRNKTHMEVIKKITKDYQWETCLLVADKCTEYYYKEQGISMDAKVLSEHYKCYSSELKVSFDHGNVKSWVDEYSFPNIEEIKENNEQALDKYFECAVCFGTFSQPYTMPCLHTYCHQCIVMLEKNATVQCPQCRLLTNMQNIKKDFRIEGIINALAKIHFEKSESCLSCDNSEETMSEQ